MVLGYAKVPVSTSEFESVLVSAAVWWSAVPLGTASECQ